MSDPVRLSRSTPLKSAKLFRERVQTTLIHQHDEFLTWDGFSYQPCEDATIRAEISEFLSEAKIAVLTKDKATGTMAEELVPFHPKKTDVAEIEAALKNICHIPAETMSPPAWLPGAPPELAALNPKSIVSCRNGLLDIDTMTFYRQTPFFYTRYALPIDYDPDATAPRLEQFLDETMLGRADLIGLLQEMFGYLISIDTSMQRVFFLFGKRGSGKGTMMRIITALCGGPANVASPSIHNFGTTFGLGNLIGRSVATVTEMSVSDRTNLNKAAEIINSVSGEDLQQIPRKFKGDWVGYLSARFMLAGNNLPNFGDHANAMMRRLLIVPFDASFEDQADPRLSAKLEEELAGILNWALAGLQRLRARGGFAEPELSTAMKKRVLHKSNPLHSFVEEYCTLEGGARVEKAVLYARYKGFCDKIGAHPKALPNFTDDLEALFPVKAIRPKSSGKRYQAYDGIRFNDDAMPKVYEVEDTDLAELGLVFESLKCDEHGWPISRNLAADDFTA